MTPPRVRLARRAHFSCGHRYFAPSLSEKENREIFGSCYSEHGHGHNYIVEGYFEGPIDPITGMILNLSEIDAILKAVIEPLDHHHLNFDVPYFAERVPTTENLAQYIYQEMSARLQHPNVKLRGVRLYEYEDLWADYGETEWL